MIRVELSELNVCRVLGSVKDERHYVRESGIEERTGILGINLTEQEAEWRHVLC